MQRICLLHHDNQGLKGLHIYIILSLKRAPPHSYYTREQTMNLKRVSHQQKYVTQKYVDQSKSAWHSLHVSPKGEGHSCMRRD